MSKVAIVKGEIPIETAIAALEMVGFDVDGALSSGKPILIKPNYMNSKHPSTVMTTDSRVVEGVRSDRSMLAEKKRLGTCNLEQIIVMGESIESVKRKFRRSFSF